MTDGCCESLTLEHAQDFAELIGVWDDAYNAGEMVYGEALDDVIGRYYKVGKLNGHPVFKKDILRIRHPES